MMATEAQDELENELSKLTFYLFSIGINSYKCHRNLRTAERGATEVSDVLVERYGFDRSNVTRLLGDQATADAIDRQLRRYAKTLKSNDVLVMYYAGHGEYDEAFTDGTYLIPHDAGKDSTALWIDHEKIKQYFGAIKARHILLVSDSCFSGGALRWINDVESPDENAFALKSIAQSSRQAITSGGLESVQDRGYAGHSVFTYFVLQALKDNDNYHFSSLDIFNSIKNGVAANSAQKPEFGSLPNSGHNGGSFWFSKTPLRAIPSSVEESAKLLSIYHKGVSYLKNQILKDSPMIYEIDLMPGFEMVCNRYNQVIRNFILLFDYGDKKKNTRFADAIFSQSILNQIDNISNLKNKTESDTHLLNYLIQLFCQGCSDVDQRHIANIILQLSSEDDVLLPHFIVTFFDEQLLRQTEYSFDL